MINDKKLNDKLNEIIAKVSRYEDEVYTYPDDVLLDKTEEFIINRKLYELLKRTTLSHYMKTVDKLIAPTYDAFIEYRIEFYISKIGYNLDDRLERKAILNYLVILVDNSAVDTKDVLGYLYKEAKVM